MSALIMILFAALVAFCGMVKAELKKQLWKDAKKEVELKEVIEPEQMAEFRERSDLKRETVINRKSVVRIENDIKRDIQEVLKKRCAADVRRIDCVTMFPHHGGTEDGELVYLSQRR